MKRVLVLAMVLCFTLCGCGEIQQNVIDTEVEPAVTDSWAYTKKALEKAIKNDPKEDDYLALADLHLEKNDKKKAIEALNAGIKKLGRTEKLGSAIEKLPRVIYDDSYLQSVYKYDEDGFLIEETTHNVGKHYVDRFRYKYDENGNMVKKTEYDHNGDILDEYEYRYDVSGNMVYDGFGGMTYEYDEKGVVVKSTSGSGDLIEYEYNKSGLLAEEIRYRNGNIHCRFKYKYDKYENLLNKKYYYSDNDEISTDTKYKYDKYGNLIEQAEYISKTEYNYKNNYLYDEKGNILQELSGDIVTRECSYDENGNMTEEKHIVMYDDGTTDERKTLYEYDGHRNKVRETSYGYYGEFDYEWKYEYDEKGNFVSAIMYGYDEKVEYELKP